MFSPKTTKKLLNLAKNKVRLVQGVLTGHFPVRNHLAKMIEVRTCRVWKLTDETAEHTYTLYLRRSISQKAAIFGRADINALASN